MENTRHGAYPIVQAEQLNPSPFMSLVGKCIPSESNVNAHVDGGFTWGAVRANTNRTPDGAAEEP